MLTILKHWSHASSRPCIQPFHSVAACLHRPSQRLLLTSLVSNQQYLEPFLDLCVSSLREGHADLLCIVHILTDVAKYENNESISDVHVLGGRLWHVHMPQLNEASASTSHGLLA